MPAGGEGAVSLRVQGGSEAGPQVPEAGDLTPALSCHSTVQPTRGWKQPSARQAGSKESAEVWPHRNHDPLSAGLTDITVCTSNPRNSPSIFP